MGSSRMHVGRVWWAVAAGCALVIAVLFSTLEPRVPAVVRAQVDELRVATWNLEWFFDADTADNRSALSVEQSAPSLQEYVERVETVADAVHELAPDILALQEVEDADVVEDVAERLRIKHDVRYHVAFVQGTDTFTEQDVAFLVKDGIVLDGTGSHFNFSGLSGSSGFRNLSKHLRIDVTVDGELYTLVTLHLIASNSANRREQARTLRHWTEGMATTGNLIILGDFNASQDFNQTTPDSEMGIIRGFGTATTNDDLFDVHLLLGERNTHIGNRELDRILVSPALQDWITSVDTRRDLAIRGQADDQECEGKSVCYRESMEDQDLSDHFPLVAVIARDATGATPTSSFPILQSRTPTPIPATATPLPTPVPTRTATATPGEDAVTRAELLAKLDEIEEQISELLLELEEVKQMIQELDE